MEKPAASEHNDEAMWRGDPAETFSDWTIEIVSKSVAGTTEEGEDDKKEVPKEEGANFVKEDVQTYHVHRAILAYGPRKSEYFVKLYRNSGNFWEFKTRTSRIEMEPLAAKAFPRLLDYLYKYSDKLDVDIETATALNFMGEYFEMMTLCSQSEAFCQSHICFENVVIFYEHSLIFHNETVLGIVLKYLASNITNLCPDSPILHQLRAEHLNGIFDLADSEKPHISDHLSKLLASFGAFGAQTLDVDVFRDISNEGKMPSVAARVALQLCELEDTILQDASGTVSSGAPESDYKEAQVLDLSSLQKRCGTSLAETWQTLDFLNADNLTLLKNRRPQFLVDLLTKTTKQATAALKDTNVRLSRAGSELCRARKKRSKTQK